MGLIFCTHASDLKDIELFRRMLSTFRDGSGIEREADGTTRAGWRQIERCVAALLDSTCGENKGIFDVIAFNNTETHKAYGFSVKSKQLSQREFKSLADKGQVYMEIANSPAKFWAEIETSHGLHEKDFRDQIRADDIGKTVISTVEKWHTLGKSEFEFRKCFHGRDPKVMLDLDLSCYFCLSYNKVKDPNTRQYQVHIFPLKYPTDIVWRYASKSCLSGYIKEDDGSETRIIDWYGLSGGQLKYYPRVTTALYSSAPFTLYLPKTLDDLKVRAQKTEFLDLAADGANAAGSG